ncbi:hypothetical protein MHU86_11418 [Fragilaria crotonensis]|nr:hypothetical protein MHU86_11418 [Fragilaria crotonensis]
MWPRGVGGVGGWGVEAEISTAKHGGRDARHHWLRLDMQVAVHFVRLVIAPPAWVDRMEMSRAVKSVRAGGRVCTARRRRAVTSVGRRTKFHAAGVGISIEQGTGRDSAGTEVEEMTDEGMVDRAPVGWMPAYTVPKCFGPDAFF